MRILYIVFLSILSLDLCAQTAVNFRPMSFKAALALAKKEGKFLFADIHNPNMAKEDRSFVDNQVFSQKEVSDFLNENFISIRVDMWQQENKYVSQYLQMNMYPAYFFFNENGDLLAVTQPYRVKNEPSTMLAVAKDAYEKGMIKRKNKREIKFVEGTFQEILKMAEEQNKLVFFDTYTAWCRPCIEMAKNVFTLDTVADFYNQNFINYKMDMEKGEGPELNKKYDIKGYPTYLYLNSKGEVVYTATGSCDPDTFIAHGHRALDSLAARNRTGILFEKGDWKSIKEKARLEKKLIFFDAYTSWCGPCKKLAKEVFTLDSVARFFNEQFVNAHFDMEKGEGIDLAKEYNIQAYPTLLFLDGDGKVVHRIVGFTQGKELIAQAEVAMAGKGLASLDEKYASGNYDDAFVQEYLTALGKAYQLDRANEVAVKYLQGKKSKEWLLEDNWKIIQRYISQTDAAPLVYVIKQRKKYYEAFGKENVDRKLYQTLIAGANKYIKTDENNKKTLDKKPFEEYLSKIASWKIEKSDEIISFARINTYRTLSEWRLFYDEVSRVIREDKIKLSSLLLYNYALVISRGDCQDPDICNAAAQWAALAMERDQKNKAFHNSYKKLQADLLEKAGNYEEAEKVRKTLEEEKTVEG